MNKYNHLNVISFPFSPLKIVILLASLYVPFAYANSLTLPADGETPASLACVYGLTPNVPGCTIKGTTAVPKTGSGAIAIIDGQDDPNALTELTEFHNQFFPNTFQQCNATNSNQPCFQQYYVTPTGATPCIAVTATSHDAHYYGIATASDFEPEIDIEWAHAMAPNASIYMVETQGWLQTEDPNAPNTTAFVHGLQCATYLLQKYNGGGIISYSNSNQEWPYETSFDANFQTPNIIYIASAGDYSAPARYPASSPYVIATGGTSIKRDASGNYKEQVWWNNGVGNDCNPQCKTGATGGPSLYEPRPSYQNTVQKIVGNHRGVPDISFAAKGIDVFCCEIPPSGLYKGNKCCGQTGRPACEAVSQCSSGQGAWVTSGGTSLAAPALAGIINSAHSGATNSAQELSVIYNGAIKNYHTYWTDITSGNNGYPALQGYDFTSGLGVPRGYGGK